LAETSTKFPRIFIWVGSAVVILAIIAAVVISNANNSKADIPVYRSMPEFQFVDQNGQPFGTGDLKGKITVLDFFFANCQGPCPVMSGNMEVLYQQFSGSDKIQFVSISVDPARDTLAALQQYARQHGVTDSRWEFLRGPIDQVADLSHNGLKLAGEMPMGHSTRFVLIDDQARVRGYYRGMDQESLKVLKTHMKQLVRQLPKNSA